MASSVHFLAAVRAVFKFGCGPEVNIYSGYCSAAASLRLRCMDVLRSGKKKGRKKKDILLQISNFVLLRVRQCSCEGWKALRVDRKNGLKGSCTADFRSEPRPMRCDARQNHRRAETSGFRANSAHSSE